MAAERTYAVDAVLPPRHFITLITPADELLYYAASAYILIAAPPCDAWPR